MKAVAYLLVLIAGVTVCLAAAMCLALFEALESVELWLMAAAENLKKDS